MNSEQTLDKHSPHRTRGYRLDELARHGVAARGLFLAAALLSFVLSVVLFFTGNESEGIFVGLWVPSILALGAFLAPRREPNPDSVRRRAPR
jgi:hypothetical protein